MFFPGDRRPRPHDGPGLYGTEDSQRNKSGGQRGVTTVIDHHRTEPQVFRAEDLNGKREYLETRSVVDFGLLAG